MELFEQSLRELTRRLEAREVSARELVEAFYRRMDAVDPKVHAIVLRRDAEARAEADKIDERRARGEPLSPLAGVPFTVKESVATQGHAVTLGVEARRQTIAPEDAVMVRLLRERGAIFTAKTNVSQFLLFHECENPLFGVTLNPFHRDRTPGGSSGGEAAALASGMSVFGLGGDIGGSIRVPAAFSGVAGLKPTGDRWSNAGSTTALAGQETVRGQCGPMARTAADLAMVFDELPAERIAEHDPAVPPLPLRKVESVRLEGMTIGVYEDDGFFAASPAVRRVVREAAERLASTGARVVELRPPAIEEMVDLYFGTLSSDGGATVDAMLQNGPLVPQLKKLRQTARMPGTARMAIATVLQARGEARLARVVRAVREKPVDEYWKMAARRTQLRREVEAAWRKDKIDVVICPPHATMALRHRDAGDFAVGGFYAMIYNLLNFPAGVVPAGEVLSSDLPRERPRDGLDRKAHAIETGAVGLPLGVQVVARPWRDEEALRVMLAIEERMADRRPKTPVEPR